MVNPLDALNELCDALGLDELDIARVEIIIDIREAPTIRIHRKPKGLDDAFTMIENYDLRKKD